MYLGRLTTTPLSATNKSLKTNEFENVDTLLINSGIRSLAKLYDSIPDYRDINHLPSEEFYSRLDTLRSTCCELRTKSAQTCVVEAVSTTTSSMSSHCASVLREKLANQTKSRPSTGKSSNKKKGERSNKSQEAYTYAQCRSETPFSFAHKIDFTKRSGTKSYKKEFEDEVKAFENTLKEFEEQLKQRHRFTSSTESKTISNKINPNINESINAKKDTAKSPFKPHVPNFRDFYRQTADNVHPGSKAGCTSFRKFLRKSFSFNDINSIADSKSSENTEIKSRLDKLSETQIVINRKPSKFSSYFAHKSSIISPENNPPKIVIESPSSETTSAKSSNRSSGGRKKKAKDKKQQRDFKVPLSIFNLSTKSECGKHPTPSPIHPVARPNLAATLRAEVSKKKVKELQNNCTYYDSTPQVDWEVRKTPAWKSLSFNESHKEILSIRLATRKAEQAMQQREYDLNMELMRQRVKSAPLLLEGATFWGPHIGKLTHTCRREGVSHCCQSNQRKMRSKSADSRRKLCGRDVTTDSECSQRSNKLNILQKIYGGSEKVHSRSGTQTSMMRKATHSDEKPRTEQTQAPQTLNDSGDELSSLDRAFL